LSGLVAVIFDLSDEVLFGIEFLLGSEMFYEVHCEEFAGEVGDVFDKQVRLDKLGTVGSHGWSAADAEGGWDLVAGLADLFGGVADFDAAGIDTVSRDSLLGRSKIGRGKAKLFAFSVSGDESADEAIWSTQGKGGVGDGAGFEQVANHGAGDPD
jgi:hypothetical protein